MVEILMKINLLHKTPICLISTFLSTSIIPSQEYSGYSLSTPSSEISLKGIHSISTPPFRRYRLSFPSFLYKAATNARIPTAPPIPATRLGAAPDDETGAGALVVAPEGLEALLVEFVATEEVGTLVVTAVTLVVLVAVVVVGAEDGLGDDEEEAAWDAVREAE
jgi:hypothetical protein